jgi:asparagine synthase (glutamine-hydrolysing)
MCGIIGYAAKSGFHERDWLLKARDMMSYRGPDNAGVWESDTSKVSFGHRRLSIIGVNKESNQPFTYTFNSKKYIITFNGEIYNFEKIRGILISFGYKFLTNSDTEVLLVSYIHWKELCLHKFEGMFSFVIYDLSEENIFFARDRAGEKPFYYFVLNDCFYFSSEFLPLISHQSLGNKIEINAVIEYFNLGFLSEEKSFNKSIKKLPAGNFGYYNLSKNTLQILQYFEVGKSNNLIKSYDSAISEFDYLFRNSVTKQLRSDVPVGILLSGGIDSSLISCIGNSINSNITNYTVDFGDNSEEIYNSKVISEYYGCSHQIFNFSDINTTNFDQILSKIDEPLADSSFIPTYLISEMINRNGGKVVLGGDGADELFGGYSYYINVPKIIKKLKLVPSPIISILAKSLNSPYLFNNLKIKKWLENINNLSQGLLPNMRNVFSINEMMELTSGKSKEHIFDLSERYYDDGESMVYNLSKFDFKLYLGSNILIKNDRASMLGSIETRAPFLDEDIINFAFGSLPDNFKIKNNKQKSFLIDYSKIIFPPNYKYNPKRGFNFTDKFVSNLSWTNYFHNVVENSNSDFINKKYLNFLIDNLGRGDSNKFNKVYSVIVLLRWISNNNLSFD